MAHPRSILRRRSVPLAVLLLALGAPRAARAQADSAVETGALQLCKFKQAIGERIKDLERIVLALHRTGVPIVAGTDQTVPGYSLHRELELYVASGFTPMEAIQAATIVPARVMHLRRVRLVVANGRRYDPAPLWRSVGFTP